MRLFFHLLRHDVTTHRVVLVCWMALLVLLPLLALVPVWPSNGPGLLLFGQVGRLALLATMIGLIAQDDGPTNPQAFWRTRPIPPAVMAVAKIVFVLSVLVALPLAVVAAVAMVAGVPAAHWSSMVREVVIEEASIALLTLLIASRTRYVSTLVIALLATVAAGALIVLGIQSTVREVLGVRFGLPVPGRDLVMPTIRMWGAVGLLGLCVLAWHGCRHRQLLVATRIVAVLSLLTPLVPPLLAFSVHVDEIRVGARVDPVSISAESLPGAPHLVGLVARPVLDGLEPDDRTQAFLLDGQLSWEGGAQPARGDREPRMVVRSDARPQSPLLGVVTRARFDELAGRPVRFDGRLNIEVRRSLTRARAPLQPGLVLTSPSARLVVQKVLPSIDWPLAVAEGLSTTTASPGSWRRSTPGYVLRDTRTGCRDVLHAMPAPGGDILQLGALPTSAMPFTMRHVRLTRARTASCEIDRGHASIEIHEVLSPQVHPARVDVQFTMPTIVTPARRATVSR